MDRFHRLPRPDVILCGSAGQGHPLIDLVEIRAYASHYLIVVSVPDAQLLPGGYQGILCDVSPAGQVCMTGRPSPGSILWNPSMAPKKRRIQLYPDKAWGISFALPGPVDSEVTHISNSRGRIVLRVWKQQQ